MREEVAAAARVLLALDARLRAPTGKPSPHASAPDARGGRQRPGRTRRRGEPRHSSSALEALYGLERRKDKLGLEGTRALLAALGDPERRFRSVHVAGTNGKGSACALIERVLRAAGVRTGLFTSPHLVDFRERIRVDGRWADEDAWLERARAHRGAARGAGRTFFEVATALGFDYFAEQQRRIGRWSRWASAAGSTRTNVLTPEVCVITAIGLDHTEILGEHDRADRRREGGHRQAGRAGGDWRDAGAGRARVIEDSRERARRGRARALGASQPVSGATSSGAWGRSSSRRARGRSATTPASRCAALDGAGRARARDRRRGACARASRPRAGRAASSPARTSRACGGTARTTWTAPSCWRARGARPAARRPARSCSPPRATRTRPRCSRPLAALVPVAHAVRDAHAAASARAAARRAGRGGRGADGYSVERDRRRRGRVPRGARSRARAACCSPARCSRWARRWRRSAARRGAEL